VTQAGDLIWQPSLLDAGQPAVDTSFLRVSRRRLDARSWVDVVPAWVDGADQLLAELIEAVGWRRRNRWMYERRVDEPRLTARWMDDGGSPIHPTIGAMRDALATRYGVEFDSAV
jgi:hypothetical protein